MKPSDGVLRRFDEDLMRRTEVRISNKTRKFVFYRPADSKRKRTRSRPSNSSSQKEPPPEDQDKRLDLLHVDLSPSPPLAILDIGQLNQLPIPCTKDVQRAVQYFTEVWAPFDAQRPRHVGHGTDWVLLRELVPFALSDPMVLMSTVAHMQLMLNKTTEPSSTRSQSVVRHATQTIRHLQTKLSSTESCMGDEVLLSMLNLAAIEFHENNFARLNVHLQAMSRIVELRGRADRLGFDGFLRNSVLAYNSVWAHVQAGRPPKLVIEYPGHPFSSALCKQISELPDGFHEPILARRICLSSIDVIHFLYTSTLRTPPNGQVPLDILKMVSAQCVCIIREPELPAFESVALMGIMAFIMHIDDSKEIRRTFRDFLQGQCQELLSTEQYLDVEHHSHHKLIVWAACLLAAKALGDLWTSRLAHKVLEDVAGDLSWEERIELCHGFFWDELFADKLLIKIREQSMRPPRIASRYALQTAKSQETLGTMINKSMAFIFENVRSPSIFQHYNEPYVA